MIHHLLHTFRTRCLIPLLIRPEPNMRDVYATKVNLSDLNAALEIVHALPEALYVYFVTADIYVSVVLTFVTWRV